jgi:lipid II:glycine glycyltransferase (peptidoglycan interpeptide bridge formation enzyme)
MPPVSLSTWQQFLSGYPNAHILQTGEWGELKASFGWRALRIVVGGVGAQVLIRGLPLGFSLAYIPKPVFREGGSDETEVFWHEVDAVCRQERAIVLKLEPDAWQAPSIGDPDLATGDATGAEAADREWQLSPHNIQPPRTIMVDLRGSEEELLGRMKQKCRYNIRLAAKKGVTVRAWSDLDAFHGMMIETGGRDGFAVHSAEYYRRAYDLFHRAGMAELLLAEFEGSPLAAVMVFAHGKRAWYLFGASTERERNRMPAHLLQWEAMRWARAHGAEEYDLWGVPDADEEALESGFENRHDGLWGVYRFKRGFGGQVLRATQARDRVYKRWLYRLYVWRYGGVIQ